MKKILVGGMTDQVGGIETFLMNYCERLTPLGFHFDFLCRYEHCAFVERIEQMGGTVYYLPQRSHSPLAYYRALNAFFQKHAKTYAVYWENDCMMNNLEPLRYAKRYGIATRIFHSHNSDNMDKSVKGKLREIMHWRNRAGIERFATDYWACSSTAGYWAFPDHVRRGEQYRVIANAVDVEHFAYQPHVREEMRRSLAVEAQYVIMHIGRFQKQKNHTFLLEAFALLCKRKPEARLLLIGEGEGLTDALAKAEQLGIAHAVRFAGYRSDVPALLQAADLFVLPSLFEGLSMVAVEAQAAGLPCLLSEGSPKETKLTESVRFLPIDDATVWATAMEEAMVNPCSREDGSAALRAKGFDLPQNITVISDFFHKAIEGKHL